MKMSCGRSVWEWKVFVFEIEIQCNCMPKLLAIWASNCERVLIGPTCTSRCLGNPRVAREGRSYKGPFQNCMPGVWESNGKLFTQTRIYFIYGKCYFSWSIENIFKLVNILYCAKFSKIRKTFTLKQTCVN